MRLAMEILISAWDNVWRAMLENANVFLWLKVYDVCVVYIYIYILYDIFKRIFLYFNFDVLTNFVF